MKGGEGMENIILDALSKLTEEEKLYLDSGKLDRNIYMESSKNTINAKKLLEAGKLITMRPHTRFVHFPEHTHDYIEMVYMYRGSTTHIVNSTEVLIEEGDTLILNPYSVQEILPAGEGDIAVNFIILPRFFEKLLSMIGEQETPLKRFILDCISSKDGQLKFLHFKSGGILPVKNLFENLIYTFLYSHASNRAIELTMGLVLLHFTNNASSLAQTNELTDLVLWVLEYIENNYKDGSLSKVADELHYDFFWLSREIKRQTGKTYTELVQEKRLSQAAFLLSNTQLRIQEIATTVGYNNQSYFYKLFEEKYGTSPKKFRSKG